MFVHSASPRRQIPARGIASLAATAAVIASVPATALAAGPPSLSSSFTPSVIAVGNTTALTFTVTNPNSSGSLSGISFTDTLPAGLVVDNPNGQNGTCGSSSTLTASPGSATISLTGGKLAAGASCTISADVTSNTPGTVQNATGAASSTEGGSGTGDTQSLTVIADPAVSLSSPRDGSTFDFGQKVIARFSCQEAPNGPGLTDCDGDAANGAPIDTSTPGPQTFTVTAISADGAVVSQTVNYTVRPDNHFTISHLTGHSNGSLGFTVKVPGPGKLAVLESAPTANQASAKTVPTPGKGRFKFAAATVRVRRNGTLHLTIKADSRGLRLVKKHHTTVLVKLIAVFTPTGGLPRSASFGGIRITG
jgi:uncharacterized repeat protein (TIGR01451 family)